MNYCRSLKFEEKPDYSYLRRLFKEIMIKNQWEFDYKYDWVIKKNGGKIPTPISPVLEAAKPIQC